PAVVDAAVIGIPDDQWGESVMAVVQLRPGAAVMREDLIVFCGQRLAGYKKPRSIDFVDELPRDAAGKLLKRKLRDAYWAGAGRARVGALWLRWAWRMLPAASSITSTGSAPAMRRCAMSRHSPASEPTRSRSISSGPWIVLPNLGCTASLSLWRAHTCWTEPMR